MSGKKVCFVIAPIGPEGSETRDRSDKVFDDVIKEVVEEFGYEPKRSDRIAEPGIITNQIIENVVGAELVIADLTDQNPNVFYELAVRHTYQKPVIQLINQDQEIPFDVATQRTINIDLGDFSTTKMAQEKMKEQIEEIESEDFSVENPVSVAGHIRELRDSEEPEKIEMAEFAEILGDISSRIRSIERDLEDPQKLLPPEYFAQIQDDFEVPGDTEEMQHRIRTIRARIKSIMKSLEEEGGIQRDHLVDELYNLDNDLFMIMNELEEKHQVKLTGFE